MNKELTEILTYVLEEPLFFGDNMRLLSKTEIENYKEELCISDNNIIPLIDLYDNDFIVYDKKNDCFGKFNIVDEIIFEKIDTIKNYINLIKNSDYKM